MSLFLLQAKGLFFCIKYATKNIFLIYILLSYLVFNRMCLCLFLLIIDIFF